MKGVPQGRYTKEFREEVVKLVTEESLPKAGCRLSLAPSTIATWLKDFMEAGKDRLTRDMALDATKGKVQELKCENARLKQLVAELFLQVYVLKKRQYRDCNKGEVCPGERYRKERDSIPGNRFRTAVPKDSGTVGTGKEHLLSLAKTAK